MRDVDVRTAIRSMLNAEHERDDDTRIVEEMGVWNGAVRVDLAVINGEFAGYEIKSARDTLMRLPNQAAIYNDVFDRVHLVAAANHLARAKETIPSWWGIIVARSSPEGVGLTVLRAGKINPRVEPIQLARLLWRDEVMSILQDYDFARGVRSAPREKVAARLVEMLSLDELRFEVRRRLKAREGWLGQPVRNQRDVAIGGKA